MLVVAGGCGGGVGGGVGGISGGGGGSGDHHCMSSQYREQLFLK